MDLLTKYTSYKFPLVSLICAIFVIYPNISFFSWDLGRLDAAEHTAYILFFCYRFLFFWALIWLLIRYNLQEIETPVFLKRLVCTFLATGVAYLIYACISIFTHHKADCFGSILLFQFLVICLVCTFIGHVFALYSEQRNKEQEIERLKIESLQSRCDALVNQINPHFFFNTLNGLSGLIRKKNDEKTLDYVDKMSDVFRYMLQCDRKGLVTLKEELAFIDAFRYMMEVRFANKLVFTIQVDKGKMNLKLPVLSLLPLIDNVVVHNTIDSDHRMEIIIRLNDREELVVSNPVYQKLSLPDTNGTGLKNLESRFALLMDKQIRIERNERLFNVYLPLHE